MSPRPTPPEEAAQLIALHGGAEHLPACLEVVARQFIVLQSRSQLLLTLATITLTITGFSGPKIAASGDIARVLMAVGLVFVLLAVVILLGTLRVRWLTQFQGASAQATLVEIIEYRNRKTKWYLLELSLLVIGLSCYVCAVVSYLIRPVIEPGAGGG